MLTLALVWVELSRRPELFFAGINPIIRSEEPKLYVLDINSLGKLSSPSRFLKIREASDLDFNKYFSYSFDIENIGYEEVVIHEYIVSIDNKEEPPVPLFSPDNLTERLTLRTQQRHPVWIFPLDFKTEGFHKVRIQVKATTIGCSKEIWLVISDNFRKLRYVEVGPRQRFLSLFVKRNLNS
jgi:hypothetical protein